MKDVALDLGGQRILQDLSFEIRDRVRPGRITGQVVALLGPSGVGKTRLLRIIAGLDAPTRGLVQGPKGSTLEAGQVGVVFQNYPLLKHRTARSNLVVAGVANGLDQARAEARATELLGRFDLAERSNLYPGQLSGGQRQRLAIAQQIVVPKTFLLLDEPFSGLDPQALMGVIRLISEVAHADELNTIVIITHDLWAAMVISDTVLLLGRNRDAEGRAIPGARIQRTIDLVDRGLAWRVDAERDPDFLRLEQELRDAFLKL